MHLTSSPVDWYAARAAGITAYVLLSSVVILGLGLASHQPGRRWKRWPMFAVEDVHRVGGLLVGVFISVHVLTIAIDSFLPFSISQLAIPLASRYRPIWTGLGIAAAELLLALAITNHYRRRLPYRWWRTAHYANFGVWIAATLHGLGAGTDRNAWWMLAIYGAATAAVAVLTLWRVAARGRLAGLRPLHLALAAAGAVAFVIAFALGPMATHASTGNADRFHDRLSGRILEQQGATQAIVSMTGVGSGAQNVLVRADLLLGQSSLEATTFQMEFLPSGLVCRGPVRQVEQFGFHGTCTAGGRSWQVDATWQLTAGNALTGSLDARR